MTLADSDRICGQNPQSYESIRLTPWLLYECPVRPVLRLPGSIRVAPAEICYTCKKQHRGFASMRRSPATITKQLILTLATASVSLTLSCNLSRSSPTNASHKQKDSSASGSPNTQNQPAESGQPGALGAKALPELIAKDLAFQRQSNNTPPISAGELSSATDAYISLLKGTRYFEVLDERIHGWPESNPAKPPFGIWWIGVQLERRGGKVVYRHHEIGSDNAAADTGDLLENLCYAQRFLGDGVHTRTLKRTAQGLAALANAMRSKSSPNQGILLSRSFYPEPVESTDQSTPIFFDYSRARPGTDNSATEYVHISDNPHWGDVWVKNKRSKDDMGHVMRGISQTSQTCKDILEGQAKTALIEAKSSHMLWAQRVISDSGAIATLDKSRKVYWPFETLARFVSFGGIECTAYLALHLFSSGGTGDYDCGNGTSGIIDWLAQINDQNLPLVESYHLAAMAGALEYSRLAGARQLADGLASRLSKMSELAYNNSWSDSYKLENFSALILRSNTLGIPLQNNEARWLQKQIINAKNSYLTPQRDHLYEFLNKAETDGIYPYTPHGDGILWRDIGAVLGTCSSAWRAQSGAKIVDCDRLRRELSGS